MPLMRRKKVVTIDRAEFLISPLSLVQVEELILARDNKSSAEAVICASLNNAAGSEVHTIESLRSEIDLPLRGQLFNEILEFSGLAREDADEGKSQGEPAASAN